MIKKILVTGAEGFIGSHLTEVLVKKGYKVKALVLYNFKNSNGWLDSIDLSIKKKLEIISGDIKDLSFMVKITKDVDAIFHLAALISIPYSYVSPKSYIDNNIFGSYNILESAKINKTIMASLKFQHRLLKVQSDSGTQICLEEDDYESEDDLNDI